MPEVPALVGIRTTVANSVIVNGDPKNIVRKRKMNFYARFLLVGCPKR